MSESEDIRINLSDNVRLIDCALFLRIILFIAMVFLVIVSFVNLVIYSSTHDLMILSNLFRYTIYLLLYFMAIFLGIGNFIIISRICHARIRYSRSFHNEI
jgi:hypothetical protein